MATAYSHRENVIKFPGRPTAVLPEGDAILGWSTFRAALTLAIAGGVLAIGSIALGMYVELQLASEAGVFTKQTSSLDLVLLTLSRLAYPASIVLLTVAACMSSGAPRQTLSRGVGFFACICAIGFVLLFVTQQVAIEQNQQAVVAEASAPWSDQELSFLQYGGKTAATLALLLFLVAMIGAARDFGSRRIGTVTMVFATCCLIVIVGLNIIDRTAADPEGSPPISPWIRLALTVGMAVWFVVLAVLTRGAVTRGILARSDRL